MKRIVHIGYILFGFILLNTKVADCITCLSCRNVADLSNCKKAIVCNANQTCFIEKILSPVDYMPVYNTGCRELDYCKLQLCNKNAYGDGNSRKKRFDNDLTLCSECCFQDSCNAEGCGYKQPTNNITQCFKCDEVYEGGPQCLTTEDCDLTLYACSVTTHHNSHRPGAYELGCKFKRAQCQLYVNLNGDQKDENVKCCGTTLCNPSPYNRKINKTVIEHDFKCPEGIIRPTTKPPLPPPTTTFPAPTTITTTTPQTTKTSNPIPTTKTTTLAVTTSVPQKTIPPVTMRSICPSDLTQRVPSQYIHVYGDKCYEFVPYAGSWMHARTDCHRKGGHMLSITNAGEQAFISNLISKGYVITKLWLGLDDRVNEGHFNWDTGVKVNYTNWAPGRNVDPYHDQRDCVVMIVARDGKWNDVDCDALVNGRIISYNWICQYNFETQVISTMPDKAVDGNWSHWHTWNACSVTCGTGSQSRTRDCNNPTPQHGGNFCFGLRTETSTCNSKDCPHN